MIAAMLTAPGAPGPEAAGPPTDILKQFNYQQILRSRYATRDVMIIMIILIMATILITILCM